MKISLALRMFLAAMVAGFFSLPFAQDPLLPDMLESGQDAWPDILQGGAWADHFLTWQLWDEVNVDLQYSYLVLKLAEALHWTQTWTGHFAGGEFFQTEAISDTVRLAPDSSGGYFTTGVYTSTVFDAGARVDWAAAEWRFSKAPPNLNVAYRTGETPTPDISWTDWTLPLLAPDEYTCAYTSNADASECWSNLGGIPSSRYLQYRVEFTSQDPAQTVALYDIDLFYGLHAPAGSASSTLVAPVDLLAWETVVVTATIPAGTSLRIDLLAADGTVLLADVRSGDSLASLDPQAYPALRLQASLATQDPAQMPAVDLWGLRWATQNRLFLPVLSYGYLP